MKYANRILLALLTIGMLCGFSTSGGGGVQPNSNAQLRSADITGSLPIAVNNADTTLAAKELCLNAVGGTNGCASGLVANRSGTTRQRQYSYYGIELQGNIATFTVPFAGPGGSNDASVTILAPPSGLGDIVDFTDSTEATVEASISPTGAGSFSDIRKSGVSIVPLALNGISATPQATVGCFDTAETITGAATTMACDASFAGALPAADMNTTAHCYVSAANTVQLHLCTLVAITGSAATYNIRVIP